MRKRQIGQTYALIESIIPYLLRDGKVSVVGCTDPVHIVERFREFGITVESKPMFYTPWPKPIYTNDSIEEAIVGFEQPEPIQTGYRFLLIKQE